MTHAAPHRISTAWRRFKGVGLAVVASALAVAAGCERSAAPSPATLPGRAARPAAPPRTAAGVVEGRVATWRDGAFVPVAGATVATEDGVTATTDAEGRYVLTGVATGERTLSVRHPAYAAVELPVRAMPGIGVPRANALLAPRDYGVRQAAASFEAVVTGVVFDPRGAALAGADVTLDCPRAHGGAGAHLVTRTNADGFFAATLANVKPEPAPAAAPTVTYGVTGTSPGGIPLATEADVTVPLTGPRLALNVQALKFPDVVPLALVGSQFVPPGEEGRFSDGNLSARPDEFYIQLQSGGDRVDALPLSVDPGQASFRMPFGLAETAVMAVVVPFGRLDRVSAPSTPFITSYTVPDLDHDLTFTPAGTITDLTGLPNTVNDSRFLGADEAKFTFTIANANPYVPQDLELTGKMPVNTVITAVTAGGGPVTFEGPDAAGQWKATGLRMPLSGELVVEVAMKSAGKLPNATPFAITEMSLSMPSLGLTKAVPPPDSPVLLAGNIDTAAFTITKEIRDDATPGNGIGTVVLTLTPVHSLAGASFKMQDATQTEAQSSATAASFSGTAVLPPAGVPMGLATGDHLDLIIDGIAARINIFGPGYDAETLIGQINTTVGVGSYVGAVRSSDHLYLERNQQGFGKTLGISANSSPNVLALLGLTPGSKGSGYYADLTQAKVTQPGGTQWSFQATFNSWGGSINNSSFTLRPPAAYKPGDGPDTPITVTYPIKKLNGNPGTAGGGTGANYVTRINTYNLYYVPGKVDDDLTFGKTNPDGPLASNL